MGPSQAVNTYADIAGVIMYLGLYEAESLQLQKGLLGPHLMSRPPGRSSTASSKLFLRHSLAASHLQQLPVHGWLPHCLAKVLAFLLWSCCKAASFECITASRDRWQHALVTPSSAAHASRQCYRQVHGIACVHGIGCADLVHHWFLILCCSSGRCYEKGR